MNNQEIANAQRLHIIQYIDDTIDRMLKKDFVEDPILGKQLSHAASIAGSTQKRHGLVLEKSILFSLKQYETLDFLVWDDPMFGVSAVADNMVNAAKDPFSLLGTDVPYGEAVRTLQIDLIVYDREKKHLSAYEIKRGNAVHDAGKKRSIIRDYVCLNLLLKEYGRSRELEVQTSSCNIIFYYGSLSIP
ncbi:hypothetical protein, partial [Sneathiella sp.]|uniref:hypothetical protein n=1 Tax=Sneathiella sp. TaxID=1964365 RepID=UPI0039E46822